MFTLKFQPLGIIFKKLHLHYLHRLGEINNKVLKFLLLPDLGLETIIK
jgi:hypothetical protein